MNVGSKIYSILIKNLKKFFGRNNDKIKYSLLFFDLFLIFSVCSFMYNLAETEGDSEEDILESKNSYSSFKIFGFFFFLLFFSKFFIWSISK
ncbi:MAG: hypothetical protein AD073_000195 [Mycoplasmataceae bacterium]|nr:MAG: hypothetical protein AD073_000195 [Mycoplasmataceae bacterium]